MDTESPTKSLPAGKNQSSAPDQVSRQQRGVMIGAIIALVVLLALLITGLVILLHPNTDPVYVARIRDVFIIMMALESLLIGLALVILIIQIARLTNLLQNEVKPIIDSTNETISTLRGTTSFLSDNVVAPVIKLNEYLAGLQQFFKVIGIARGNRQNKNKEGE